MKKVTPGPLVIIGGAEEKEGASPILTRFVQLAGGKRSHIVVVTVATELPQEVGDEYIAVFRRLGATDISVLNVATRQEATEPKLLECIDKATALFFTGGNQMRITNLLAGTPLDTHSHARHRDGMVVGGTSAGAAVMADTMIVGGPALTHPQSGTVQLSPGMSFLPGVVIDQHFAQRGRLGRLLSAVARHPGHLGIGIDENTAVVVAHDTMEVIGAGAVLAVDASSLTYTNLPEINETEDLALFGITLHVLPAGYRFRMDDRTPLPKTRNSKRAKH